MNLNRRSFAHIAALFAAGGTTGSVWALSDEKAATSATPSRALPDAIYALVDYCLATPYESLPAKVIEATKFQILDTVAVALPALHADGIRQLYDWTRETSGKGESLVLGTPVRVPAESAARLNASMAAALEFDDTFEPSLMHASCVTIPTALATADWVKGVSGKELIAAVAVGTDIACRLSRAGSPGVSPFVVGWDPTPMYGFLSATMVAGRLMKLSREQVVAAVGLAYHQMSGNAQASVDGTLAKRLGAGFAAYGGMMSARLAKHGVFGSDHVLEGLKGLFKQYHGGKYSKDALLGGLGTSFAGPDIAPKPYPSCRGGHVAIDGTLALVTVNNLRPDQIAKVTVYSPPAEIMLLGAPIEKKRNPKTIVEAQFSNPWMVAAAIQDREVGLRHFTLEALQRADLKALTARTFTVEDKTLVRPDGGPGFARVEIETGGGKTFTKQVEFAKGDPKNPMTAAEFQKKLFECTDAAGMKRAQAQGILQRIQSLEAEADVSALQAAMAI
ncbi:MmgE/PrpD family protein [Diaphorobacter sp. HDW4A]|uniref:MmgE/PrpD family protein n=1 Tax=Diaphorobacter sp. HDW4A TaxID=2714924 RepID=UPI00140823E4|nr:MmgE/PrpD family protein [Diaphorobacter sp. HDW4A]QIL79630.1 MmgE/PrpD family protein [Diaphorobacter sp. HDW4A]